MALIEDHATEQAEAGWFPDPQGEHQLRYYNGGTWTAHVTHNGPTPCHGCYGDPDLG